MTNQIELSSTQLTLKLSSGGTLKLDLEEVSHLESRKVEAATVTKFKAQELLSAMERGHSLVVTKLLPNVSIEAALAKQAMEARKAVIFLDEAPEILKKKGLAKASAPAGTLDQRENLLALDQEYKNLEMMVEQLKAVKALLIGKARGFELTHQSIRATAAENRYDRGNISLPNIPDEATAGDDVQVSVYGNTKIGTPRY
jgi:hypothetical protein